MNKIWIFLALMCVGFTACSGDELMEEEMMEEDDCADTNFTYTNDVKQILESSCALSGCHNGQTSLPDYTNYDGIFAVSTRAASRVQSRSMPPASAGITLSDSDINTIVCWVENGAPE